MTHSDSANLDSQVSNLTGRQSRTESTGCSNELASGSFAWNCSPLVHHSPEILQVRKSFENFAETLEDFEYEQIRNSLRVLRNKTDGMVVLYSEVAVLPSWMLMKKEVIKIVVRVLEQVFELVLDGDSDRFGRNIKQNDQLQLSNQNLMHEKITMIFYFRTTSSSKIEIIGKEEITEDSQTVVVSMSQCESWHDCSEVEIFKSLANKELIQQSAMLHTGVLIKDLLSNEIRIQDPFEFYQNDFFIEESKASCFKILAMRSLELEELKELPDLDTRKSVTSSQLLLNLIKSKRKSPYLFCLPSKFDSDFLRSNKFFDFFEGLKEEKEDLKLRDIFECLLDNEETENWDRFKDRNWTKDSDLFLKYPVSFGPLHIVMVTPEYRGVAVVGGVGNMVADLAENLAALGERVFVVIPLYPGKGTNGMRYIKEMEIIVGNEVVHLEIWNISINGVSIYLYSNPEVCDLVYPISVS